MVLNHPDYTITNQPPNFHPGVNKLTITFTDGVSEYFEIDERDNTIQFTDWTSHKDVEEYLKSKYQEIKSLDFRYGVYEVYDPSLILSIEDFYNEIKKDGRDKTIINILWE